MEVRIVDSITTIIDQLEFKKAIGYYKNNNILCWRNLMELKCSHPKKIDKFCVADVNWMRERFPVLTKVVGLKEVKPYVPGGKYPANAELFYFLDANQAKWAAQKELLSCIYKFYPNLDKNVAKIIGGYVLKILDWPSPKRQEFTENCKLDKLKIRLKQLNKKKDVLKLREEELRERHEEVEKELNEATRDRKRLKKLVAILEK